MDILHRRQRATVEDIRSGLPDTPTPSSVRKLLEIMIDRGLLNREGTTAYDSRNPAVKPETSRRLGNPAPGENVLQRPPISAMAALIDATDEPLSEADTSAWRRC